jgi:hypothetical protein
VRASTVAHCRFGLRFIAENACWPLKKRVFPLFHLVGIHVELLGQFHQRLLSANATFALEAWLCSGTVVLSWHLLFPASAPKSGRNFPYLSVAGFPIHLRLDAWLKLGDSFTTKRS